MAEILIGKHESGKMWETDFGQVMLSVHAQTEECLIYNCVIHNPSARALRLGPTFYNTSERRMERVCKHEVHHPDPDSQDWAVRKFGVTAAEHECDGCCSRWPPGSRS